MPDIDPAAGRPTRNPGPPAPPATGGPGGHPDPADSGPAIPVQLGARLLDDLGHPTVDARLLAALLLRDGTWAGGSADAASSATPCTHLFRIRGVIGGRLRLPTLRAQCRCMPAIRRTQGCSLSRKEQ